MAKKQILVCVGARPNMMKAAALFRVRDHFPDLNLRLLHTGQHYSDEMDGVFQRELDIPEPEFKLGIGSASHAVQTAKIMVAFEQVLMDVPTDFILVFGDINSTLACTLVASKLGRKVAHIEAGLRSFDRQMPEEINRVVTDHLSDLLFTTEPSGNQNLSREGVDQAKIHFSGNTMIDTLIAKESVIRDHAILKEYGLHEGTYVVLTLHRPSNVDTVNTLREKLTRIVENVPKGLQIVFAVHPRTRGILEQIPTQLLSSFLLIPPQSYLRFLTLVNHSAFVLTDSGGIQEETTYLKKPCFTLRANTERPVTVDIGSNHLIGDDLAVLGGLLENFPARRCQVPERWDGQAGMRILNVLSGAL